MFAACAVGLQSATHAADASNGKRLYESRCIACHSIDVSLAGPAHRGVFGRKAGTVAGFEYSAALKKARVVWNEDTLDRWLANPEKLIPGQRMNYLVTEPEARADLIAYLKSQF